MKPSEYEISGLSMKILYIGLFINVVGAVIVFFGGTYLVDNVLEKIADPEKMKVFGYALLAVSIIELVAIFFMKRNFFNPDNIKRMNPRTFMQFAGQIKVYYLILYFLAFAPSIYGLLYYYLCGDQNMFVLMICITLIGYMMIRPKPSFIQKMVEPLEFDDV